MSKYFSGLLAAAIVAFSFVSPPAAYAASLPPIAVDAYAGVNEVVDGSYVTTDQEVTNPGPGIGAIAGAQNSQASAAATITNIVSPSVYAGVKTYADTYQAFANSQLTYFLQVTSSVGAVSGINVIANGSYSVAANGSGGLDDQVALIVNECYSSDCMSYSSPLNSMSYSGAATAGPVPYSISLSLATGVDYRIYISAGADDYGLTGSVSATLDPIFTITDPNAQDYQLVFDDGINNGATSATPLPAALPLFGTGVGALGLLGWRRKRKAQTVAA